MLKRQTLVFLGCSLALSHTLWAADCSTKKPERFVDFFPAFSASKGFALNRTVTGPNKTYLSSSEY